MIVLLNNLNFVIGSTIKIISEEECLALIEKLISKSKKFV